MPPTRAFVTHNLRWNPFEELPLEERHLIAVEIPELELKIGHAILILGEKGRGKTTHLLKLRQQHPNAPYIYLPEFGTQPRVPKADLIFLDEAQRLPHFFRRQIWKRAKSWVIASHQNHQDELRRAGFTTQILHLHGLSLGKLEQIMQRRLEWARRNAGDLPQVPTQILEALLKQYHDDLRSIEDALYTYYQNLEV
ncbi:MAG: hypothetical protein ACK41E_07690 [Deinococcales bacterium]